MFFLEGGGGSANFIFMGVGIFPLYNTLFLQDWGLYEFRFLRDRPYISKGKRALSLMNGL